MAAASQPAELTAKGLKQAILDLRQQFREEREAAIKGIESSLKTLYTDQEPEKIRRLANDVAALFKVCVSAGAGRVFFASMCGWYSVLTHTCIGPTASGGPQKNRSGCQCLLSHRVQQRKASPHPTHVCPGAGGKGRRGGCGNVVFFVVAWQHLACNSFLFCSRLSTNPHSSIEGLQTIPRHPHLRHHHATGAR